jgi:2-methylcitrate dehydratase PrpD
MKGTCSEQLASFLVQLKYHDLPEDVIRMVKRCILDWLGCVFASMRMEPIRKIADLVKMYGGNPNATVIPYLEKSTSLFASFVNGAAAHAMEIDDVHQESITHPACVVIPAVIAVGERENIGGRDIIEAVVAGYEMMIRVGEAVGRSHYQFWHNTSTCGTFGASAGAGKILGLSECEYVHALGNAGSQSSGLWEFLEDGANTKFMHAGKAAMNGIIAADLASKGFTGPSKIFEGKKGFLLATSRDSDPEKLIAGLEGKTLKYKILSDSFKFYPSCRHTHPSIDATLLLVSGHGIDAKDVERIDVYTYSEAVNLCGYGKIKNPYRAKFHIPFAIATALIYRKVWFDSFTSSRVVDRKLLDLMERVYVHPDKEFDGLYPLKWPSRVVMHLKKGGSIEQIVYTPKGDPENPPTDDEIRDKFWENVKDRISKESIELIIKKVEELENIGLITELFDNIEFF